MDFLFTWLGFIAGFLTTLSFVPQAVQSWKTQSAGDFSWTWLLTFSTGVLLWFAYGLHLQSWPMILANSITFLLIVPVIIVKIRSGKQAPQP